MTEVAFSPVHAVRVNAKPKPRIHTADPHSPNPHLTNVDLYVSESATRIIDEYQSNFVPVSFQAEGSKTTIFSRNHVTSLALNLLKTSDSRNNNIEILNVAHAASLFSASRPRIRDPSPSHSGIKPERNSKSAKNELPGDEAPKEWKEQFGIRPPSSVSRNEVIGLNAVQIQYPVLAHEQADDAIEDESVKRPISGRVSLRLGLGNDVFALP